MLVSSAGVQRTEAGGKVRREPTRSARSVRVPRGGQVRAEEDSSPVCCAAAAGEG